MSRKTAPHKRSAFRRDATRNTKTPPKFIGGGKQAFAAAKLMGDKISAIVKEYAANFSARDAALALLEPYVSRGKGIAKYVGSSRRCVAQDKRDAVKAGNKK